MEKPQSEKTATNSATIKQYAPAKALAITRKHIAQLLASSLTIGSHIVLASDDLFDTSAPSSLTAGFSFDSEQGHDWSIDTDLNSNKNSRILAGYRKSDTEYLGTQSYYLGLGTNPFDDVSASFDIGYWGHKNSLIIRHLKTHTSFNSQNWSFDINAQLQGITLYADRSLFNINLDRIELHSVGLGTGIQYLGLQSWSFSLGYDKNGFSRDISAISRSTAVRRLFLPSTLSLSTSLVRQSLFAAIDYYWPSVGLGIQWQSVQSAVDNEFSHISSVNLSWSPFELLEFKLELGVQAYSDTEILFGEGLVSIFW